MTDPGADRLSIVNARVFTADRAHPFAEAVAVAGGRIVAVGTEKEVLELGGGGRLGGEVIDAGGNTVLPGLVDAHNHYVATGESMASLDVRFPQVASVADLTRAIARAAASAPRGATLHAYGYDDAKYERPPTAADLDAAAPGHPVVVGHVSGHYVLVNSAVMRTCGVDETTPDPPGGEIGRDAQGRPSGVFRDAACALVRPAAVDIGHHGPNFHVAVDQATLVEGIEVAGRAYLAVGLTTVCDAQVTARELGAYTVARRAGRLPLRTVCMPLSHQLEAFDATGISSGLGDEWLSLGAMKFYCDGSLIGGTAAFSEPYGEDHQFCGVLYWPPDELAAAIVHAHRSGWQVGVHAQGDRAIGIVLDAFSAAQRARPGRDARYRIEHAGYPTDAQLETMAALGVICVAQPNYLRDSGDEFLVRLGPRAHGLQPLRRALRAGVRVVVSSDSDVTTYDPFHTIAAALERRTSSGAEIGPDERLSVEEAVLAHTIDAAFSIRKDHLVGSIEVGKLADLVVVGGDLFGADPEAIRSMGVDVTVVGGRVGYRRA